jgi:hypothetical protein
MKHIHLYEHFIELNEAKVRLDALANQLISATFKKWTTDFKSGKSESSFFDQIEMTGLEFDLDANIRFNSKGFDILDSTGADARDYDEDEDDDQTPFIIIDFAVNKDWLPGYWTEVYRHLSDVMRHEIEHITQGGQGIGNYRAGKPSDDDSDMRMLIKSGILPQHMYLLLPKEVDANLQGLRFEAKKRKIPMIDAVNSYLDTQDYLTPEIREEVLKAWRERAAKIGGIPKF